MAVIVLFSLSVRLFNYGALEKSSGLMQEHFPKFSLNLFSCKVCFHEDALEWPFSHRGAQSPAGGTRYKKEPVRHEVRWLKYCTSWLLEPNTRRFFCINVNMNGWKPAVGARQWCTLTPPLLGRQATALSVLENQTGFGKTDPAKSLENNERKRVKHKHTSCTSRSTTVVLGWHLTSVCNDRLLHVDTSLSGNTRSLFVPVFLCMRPVQKKWECALQFVSPVSTHSDTHLPHLGLRCGFALLWDQRPVHPFHSIVHQHRACSLAAFPGGGRS